MKLVIIFGPPAVGKMTVGYELARQTGLKLFHNHMTIDLVLNFFEFGDPRFHQLINEFRRRIFETVAASDLKGLVFTYVWSFDDESDKNFIDKSCQIFYEKGADVCFVELEADFDERLKRNETEFRLAQKTSKRDIKKSKANLLDMQEKYRMNSNGDFFYPENYLKINNTSLSPEETAEKIARKFDLL